MSRLTDIDEGGLPVHLPMLVTIDGRGPCDDDDPLGHHYTCWCGTECPWEQALDHNYWRGRDDA